MFRLRAYQKEALSAVMASIKTNKNVLVQAATGAGKTILFSALIKQFLKSKKDARVYVLAHREQLIWQARSKLTQVWPECEKEIGLACASTGRKVDVYKPIVIGSPQTLSRGPETLPRADMMIIDECHRLAPANKDSQYRRLIDAMRSKSPEMRLVGVTATPYRLGQGLIYGEQCKDKGANWFDSMCFSIGTELLQEQGYLVPLRLFAPVDPDLSEVGTADGDYIVKQLSDTMSKAVHVHSALDAVERHASDRKHIVVFAVSIQHAEILRDSFRETGRKAEAVHSKMPHADRARFLKAFDDGEIEVLCNVGVLTEGWDCKPVDCMVMCRPTKSPALYVQMAGRGLRTCKGKKDCIMLDVSGNWTRHGRPENPDVRTGGRKEIEKPQSRRCPECGFINKKTAVICVNCGYDWQTKNGILCPECGSENGKYNIKCFKCGYIFNEHEKVVLEEKTSVAVNLGERHKYEKEQKIIKDIDGKIFLQRKDGCYVDIENPWTSARQMVFSDSFYRYMFPFNVGNERNLREGIKKTRDEVVFLSIAKFGQPAHERRSDILRILYNHSGDEVLAQAEKEFLRIRDECFCKRRITKSDIRNEQMAIEATNNVKIFSTFIQKIRDSPWCDEAGINICEAKNWTYFGIANRATNSIALLDDCTVAELSRESSEFLAKENGVLSFFEYKFIFATTIHICWNVYEMNPTNRWSRSYA